MRLSRSNSSSACARGRVDQRAAAHLPARVLGRVRSAESGANSAWRGCAAIRNCATRCVRSTDQWGLRGRWRHRVSRHGAVFYRFMERGPGSPATGVRRPCGCTVHEQRSMRKHRSMIVFAQLAWNRTRREPALLDPRAGACRGLVDQLRTLRVVIGRHLERTERRHDMNVRARPYSSRSRTSCRAITSVSACVACAIGLRGGRATHRRTRPATRRSAWRRARSRPRSAYCSRRRRRRVPCRRC